MEKQVTLLSSQLFQKHRQVEVVLSRSVLAWKPVEKSRKPCSGTCDSGKCDISVGFMGETEEIDTG